MHKTVYDFDRTVYSGDSAIDFYRFCLRQQPGLLRYVPMQLFAGFLYFVKMVSKRSCKEYFFCFLKGIPEGELDSYVERFWKEHDNRLKEWYLDKNHENDVIVSASADFLLKPIMAKLGVPLLIATKVDPQTGKVYGKSCYGRQKVVQFSEACPEGKIIEFYSDSRSDAPLAKMAERAFKVKGDEIHSWPYKKVFLKKEKKQ